MTSNRTVAVIAGEAVSDSELAGGDAASFTPAEARPLPVDSIGPADVVVTEDALLDFGAGLGGRLSEDSHLIGTSALARLSVNPWPEGLPSGPVARPEWTD